jgi:thermitase
MWRYIFSFAIVLGLGLFIISENRDPLDNGPEVYSTQREITSKQALLQQDVQITDDLCRSQCSLDYVHMAQKISDGFPAEQVMKQMQSDHEKMDTLIWSSHDQSIEQGVKVGDVPESYKEPADNYMKEAKEAVKAGNHYESPQFGQGSFVYFVLGIPSTDKQHSLVGVIHQDILKQVANHQKKNLRLEPYPNEKRWKVESVDTDTLQDKLVDHPEDNQGTSHYQKNEVVVKFNQIPTEEQLAQIKTEIGSGTVKKVGYTYVFQAEGMDAKQLMSYFQKWNVQYAEPHYLYLTNDHLGKLKENPSKFFKPSALKALQPKAMTVSQDRVNHNEITSNFTPNDNLYSKYQWNLPLIDTMQGWEVTRGEEDVIVAVVDTGVDLKHPDLQGHLLPGYNVVAQNNVPDDDVGHGTHVAGVISASVNNNLGVAGMTWFNKILPVKVLDETGAGSTYAVAQGIIWAADHGAKVINMSLGNYADSEFLHDAIKYAYDKDIVLIAASGNDNTERPGFPAAYPEVFAVAATDSNKIKASFSNYGDYIDVTAPGVSIASTYPNNQYAALSGTSMASPHVTALAALIRSTNPLLTHEEIYEIMRQSAQDLGDKGRDKYYGYGLIDVVSAVQSANKAKSALSYWPEFTARQLAQVNLKYAQ